MLKRDRRTHCALDIKIPPAFSSGQCRRHDPSIICKRDFARGGLCTYER